MRVAVLRREDEDVSVAHFTLHSHHLAKLDRFVAQAWRDTSGTAASSPKEP